VILDKKYTGISNRLAWSHLILTNLGIAPVSLMMIYAGYIGDFAITPVENGGWGFTLEQTSEIPVYPFKLLKFCIRRLYINIYEMF